MALTKLGNTAFTTVPASVLSGPIPSARFPVALPAVSGANLTNLPKSGGVVTATANGAITAGKTVVLNSNGMVSEIAAVNIAQAIGSEYTQSGETTCEVNQLVYDTTNNVFIWGGKNTISASNTGRTYALSMNSSLVISEAAPPVTAAGIQNNAWSGIYDATMNRAIFHGTNGSAHVTACTVQYVSGVMKVSPTITWKTSNYPYGFSRGFDADELMAAYQSNQSNLKLAFVDATLGSDASGDSFANFTAEIDPDELDSTDASDAYYSQIIPFTSVSKYLIGNFAYRSTGADYAFEFAVGTIGGSSGGSRTFTKQSGGIITSSGVSSSGVSVSTDPVGFTSAGRVRYDATKDRAFVFDSEFLYSISVNSSGVASCSPLTTIQAADEVLNMRDVISIPNSDHIVLFYADQSNSNRATYQVVTHRPGTTAAEDTFVLEGSAVEINTDAVALQYTPIAYSPDVDAFMIKPYRSSVAQPFYGIRVARTTTNVKATGISGRYLGVATTSVSSGQPAEIAVKGSTVTMAAGGMTIGDTYYPQNDGTVGTTDKGFGTAGIAVSATELLLE